VLRGWWGGWECVPDLWACLAVPHSRPAFVRCEFGAKPVCPLLLRLEKERKGFGLAILRSRRVFDRCVLVFCQCLSLSFGTRIVQTDVAI